MKLIATLAIPVAILAAQSSRSATHTVTAVRHWSQSETTRIAVEVSGSFEYRTERLHNPERVYFDILNSRPRIDARRIYSEEIGDKLVSRVRVAETNPGVTRVVLDLAGAVEATASQLSNPNRLIIELKAGSAPPIPTAAPSPPPPAIVSPILTAPAPPPAAKPAPKTESATIPAPRTVRNEVAAAPGPPSSALKTEPPLPKLDPLPAETAKAAHRTTSGNTSLIRALGLKLGRVVIDPGHGGHDQGTEGKGLLEKDLVLDMAKRVGALIEDRLGAEVIYTRTDDTFIPLEARTALANDNKADLFLSIHANSSPVPRIAGVETYYRSFTNARDAIEVAARENASSQKSIAELEDVIHTMMLGDKVEESKDFAGRIQNSLFSFSSRTFPGIRDRGVKKAPFVVLNGAKAPSVLVEIGFLSNAREEALLRKPEYRQKLAEALFRGLSKYAESLSHFQVAKAGNEE
jgi:N-acetylmuramoyl-L-alanine amidase